MKLSDFDYNLPQKFIAQNPVSPRDHSKLMILDKKQQKIEHKYFYNLPDYLQPGDVLVLNDTKVFPARLIGRRQLTGGRVEVFLLKSVGPSSNQWQALIGNRRKSVGQIVEFGRGLTGEIIERLDDSVWQIRFNKSGRALEKLIDQLGQVPTPPYIKIKGQRSKSKKFQDDYQTVYAKHRGSVAAPTAGFHFTKSLINKLKSRGVQLEFVTLHVGWGTFAPVKSQNVKNHQLHSEFASLNKKTAQRLNQAKKQGRRIIAVGTTATRVLETFSSKQGAVQANSAEVKVFIYPGYKFKFLDALITNFHLPKSTLLMLVAALVGRKKILRAYQIAQQKSYRFFSFGDGMLII